MARKLPKNKIKWQSAWVEGYGMPFTGAIVGVSLYLGVEGSVCV